MKKRINKFERRLRYLIVTALLADITAALMLIASIILLVITLFVS